MSPSELHNELIKNKIKELFQERHKNKVFINLFKEENSHINKRIIELKTKIK